MAFPFVGDSRKPRGPGGLPMQDFSWARRGVPLSNRTCLLGCRIAGRKDSEGDDGHHVIEAGTIGDVTGAMLWKAGGRSLPAWRFTPFAVITTHGATTPGGEAGPITPGEPPGGGSAVTPGGGSYAPPAGDVPSDTRTP
jgi:hypothetical protein